MASYRHRAQQATQFERDLRVKEQQLAQRERALQDRERMLFTRDKLPPLSGRYYEGMQALADMLAVKWGDTPEVQSYRRGSLA